LESKVTDERDASLAGVLTKDEICRWMQQPDVRQRLVITPLLERDESIGPSSIDVRLGKFLIFKRELFPALDVGRSDLAHFESHRYQERLIRPFGEQLVLHPRELLIGSTLEYIQIPKGLMAYVVGKSSWGRMGLIIATATKVDPGFRGCITLEIVNEGEIPLMLYPGLLIAQLVLHTVVGDAAYGGSYECPIGPQFPRLRPSDKRWAFWTRKTP
jgi:dCTP deaminase